MKAFDISIPKDGKMVIVVEDNMTFFSQTSNGRIIVIVENNEGK